MNLIATTYSGGYDLFNGCPNLKDAKIVDVEYVENKDDYITILTILAKNGLEHTIEIRQER